MPKQGKQDFSIDSKAFETAGWVIKKEDLKVRELNRRMLFAASRLT